MSDVDLQDNLQDNLKEVVHRLFHRIRHRFKLGMREYLAALDAVDGDQASSVDELKIVLELLWCHLLTDLGTFKLNWDAVVAQVSSAASSRASGNALDKDLEAPVNSSSDRPPSPTVPPPPPPVSTSDNTPRPVQQENRLAPLAVRSPLSPVDDMESTELQQYWPVSRRRMAYIWRYLRRPLADGPADVLDLSATVERVTRQGFFLAPVYRRRDMNYARLLLLIDQDGSMTPFHRFSRDVVESVQQESNLQPEFVSVYYFHNLLGNAVYQTPQLTQPVDLEAALAECDGETSVLIVSDAGAARGHRRMERIVATTEFLVELKQHTALIAWLNPMPFPRWRDTSAEVIARLVPMEPMDADGFGNTIDSVRGQ